jgi:hypothetical protein
LKIEPEFYPTTLHFLSLLAALDAGRNDEYRNSPSRSVIAAGAVSDRFRAAGLRPPPAADPLFESAYPEPLLKPARGRLVRPEQLLSRPVAVRFAFETSFRGSAQPASVTTTAASCSCFVLKHLLLLGPHTA